MLLDTLFDDQSGAVRYLDQYGDAVAEMVKHLIGPFLSRALLEGDMQDYLRFRAFEGGSHSKNPLEDVSPVDLVNWCRNAGDERAWALVSNAIAPFGSCHEGGTVELSEQAVAILRNAPEPVDVLKVYIEAVSPMSCSGSRVDIVARRIAALACLDTSHLSSVEALLTTELPRLQKIEREARERETNRDRESEQRFE